ncbi:MAG: DinB family protein [Bacteroidetes bacterium]|nr:DinB family protein [Bacteroidota bacterium]
MTSSEKLQNELQSVLSGDPWYGDNVYSIIEGVTFEAAFEKPPGAAHTIAGIVLHMLSWTEEVLDRLNGKDAGPPLSGDWPETGTPDEQKWQNYVNDLKLVNVNLQRVISEFPEEKWSDPMSKREPSLGTDVTYEELVNGLIRHHIYHSGQIALLTRITQIYE